MITKLSKRLVSFYIKKNFIKEEDRETYDYCFDVLLSTILNAIALIIVGFSCQKYLATILFMAIFVTFREVCGGWHAKTHLGCFSSLMLSFAVLLILTYLPREIQFYISIPMIIIAFIVNIIFAPIGCKTREIETAQKWKLKIKCIIFNLIMLSIYIIISLFETVRYIGLITVYPCFIISLLVLSSKIKSIFEKEKEVRTND